MVKHILKNLKDTIKKSKLSIMAILIILIFTILSIFAFISPYEANGIELISRLQPPSKTHWFGTDNMGRDYFTRILYGGRISLSVGFLSMLISTTIGTIVGTVCGYFEGKLDSIIMRIVDILMCIPSFFIILILNSYFKTGIVTIVCIIGLLGWMGTSRLVRAQTLSVKKQEYVLYAQSLGMPVHKIILRHIIPNILPTIIITSSISIAGAILTESSLSFLGVGISDPMASWGSMLSMSQAHIENQIYLSIFPGMFILLTVLSFNVIGNIIRDSLEGKS